MAITLRGDRPAKVVFPSDRGTQYASAQITAFATANGLTRSMGYTGICWDNAMAESFFATLKTEFYYRRVWPTKKSARIEVGKWIEDRYNRRRRQASIGQITPRGLRTAILTPDRGLSKSRITRVHETGAGPHIHDRSRLLARQLERRLRFHDPITR